jgi:uncharacterized linocin/CFP29 family protein
VNHLRRELAPVTDAAWAQITEEATRSLKHFLAARKLIDVTGPEGWEASSVDIGRADAIEGPAAGVAAHQRNVLGLVELRTPFELSLAELDRADRGATDLDLGAVVAAATLAATAEDATVFHGYAAAGLAGVGSASPHNPIDIAEEYDNYPRTAAMAVATLRAAGVDGPYAIALGPRCYTGVIETTEHGGYPVFDHLKLIAGGPVVWAPAVDGAVVLSQRGGDFELVLGQDFSIGYEGADADSVRLYLEESLAVRINSPEAAIRLVYP